MQGWLDWLAIVFTQKEKDVLPCSPLTTNAEVLLPMQDAAAQKRHNNVFLNDREPLEYCFTVTNEVGAPL